MKYKISWSLALFLSIGIFLFISFKTAYQINNFFALNSLVQANLQNLEIKQDKKDRFEVIAFYNFKILDENFYNFKKFQKKFISDFSANEFKENILKKNDFKIFYNKKNPNFSSVEKKFPIKDLIYSIISFIVFVYFIILRYYVFSFQKVG